MKNAVISVKAASGPSAKTVALIAAAIGLMLEKKHKIVSIEELNMKPDTPLYILNPWSMEGRFQLFGSHRVR